MDFSGLSRVFLCLRVLPLGLGQRMPFPPSGADTHHLRRISRESGQLGSIHRADRCSLLDCLLLLSSGRYWTANSPFCTLKMSSPSKADLPKVPSLLKAELAHFDSSKMKHAETQEKNPLPSKDDVQQEKVHNSILTSVEEFERSKLNRTETQEKVCLPNADEIEKEKGHQKLVQGIENFDTSNLKHAETQEKNPLPTKEAIAMEKGVA